MLLDIKMLLHNIIAETFINELIKNKESIFYQFEYIDVLKYIDENKITFSVDLNNDIILTDKDKTKNKIFKNNHKNDKATEAIKYLIIEDLSIDEETKKI